MVLLYVSVDLVVYSVRKTPGHILSNLHNALGIGHTCSSINGVVGVQIDPELSKSVSPIVSDDLHTVEGIDGMLDLPVGRDLHNKAKLFTHIVDRIEHPGPQISVNSPAMRVGRPPRSETVNNIRTITVELINSFMRYSMLQVEHKGVQLRSVHMLVTQGQWSVGFSAPFDDAIVT
jgi:hypothetical protein